MVSTLRTQFNNNFSQDNYTAYIQALNKLHPAGIDFRIAETPIFVDKAFTSKMLNACEHIIDVITQTNFDIITERAIPEELKVKGEQGNCQFIALDFGICENEKGELEPQLIEMQGFPSLFAYQIDHAAITEHFFDIPSNYSTLLSGLTSESYITLLKEIILGNHAPENVVLLEILPHQQKTKIDFYSTEKYVGIKAICVTELIKEGNALFYLLNGVKTPIHRIYNRVIFDDLNKQSEAVKNAGNIMFEELDVEWAPHPNWFYRISKYTLPFIQHPYVPETRFLDKVAQLPTDLENYVLKPLFSFAGQGVIIDIEAGDIEKITDPENWILQKKVQYANVIPTPDVPAKAEIRIFYFWKDGAARPIPTNNLARLSKGKMIGVRYNQDKTWVGGSLAYFER